MSTFHYNVNKLQKLSEHQLRDEKLNWHETYRHSAYISIGGLHTGLTEGDIVIVFSQWGEVVDVNLVREKETGKSKGFAFLAYEDQRSTDLAIDNANGMILLNKRLRVDHVTEYKAPIRTDPSRLDEDGHPLQLPYEATGAEGGGICVFGITEDEKRKIGSMSDVKYEDKTKLKVDPDEQWAKEFEESLKNEK
eukprot:GHVP01016008.1.p1 GENE.GHVP01016008.1~~GHVP01016008.1.p1  ORF type:complete len:200 (+),score=41.38 GHVP01016008.1:24-602(+)